MRRYRPPSLYRHSRFPSPSPPPSSSRTSRSRSPKSLISQRRSRSPSLTPLPSTSRRSSSRSKSPILQPAMSYDVSSRKRFRQSSDSSFGVPTLLQNWEFDPDYGIVHPGSGCNICVPYMTHMAEASYSENQPSFQLALKDRDSQRDVYFFDGVREGRRRQHNDDEHLLDDLERYRAERNEALENLGRCRVERNSALEELRFVQEKLRAAQVECDRLRQSIEVLSRENLDQANQVSRLEVLEVEQMLLNPECSHAANTAKGAEAPSDTSVIRTSIQSSGVVHSPKKEPLAPPLVSGLGGHDQQPPPSAPPIATYASAASSQPSRVIPAHPSNFKPSAPTQVTSIVGHPLANLPARPPNPAVVDPHATSTHPSTTVPSATGRHSNPKTIRQLNSLMNAAHQPGNDGALNKVKAMCSEAHQTPREQKTELQRYLLSNWRNPAPPSDVLSYHVPLPTQPPPRTNPRMDDPVGIWYDYLSTHQGSWPRGVRRDSRGRPNLPDLKASRAVARLRPPVDVGNNTTRSEFMSYVARLFAVPGTYQDYIQKLGLRVASGVFYKPYTGPASITLEDVARHFADCGITIAVATQEIEPWAREYQVSASIANTAGGPGVEQCRSAIGMFNEHPPEAASGLSKARKGDTRVA